MNIGHLRKVFSITLNDNDYQYYKNNLMIIINSVNLIH